MKERDSRTGHLKFFVLRRLAEHESVRDCRIGGEVACDQYVPRTGYQQRSQLRHQELGQPYLLILRAGTPHRHRKRPQQQHSVQRRSQDQCELRRPAPDFVRALQPARRFFSRDQLSNRPNRRRRSTVQPAGQVLAEARALCILKRLLLRCKPA